MALRGTPRLSVVPASQNTASVNEYRCLFTSDVRRKQKRWQDGYLKFHTFNSRVMVYDTSRNFLGDTYWKESSQVGEGDELTLDKGIMVQVAEAMGVTQTDLTPLLERAKDSPQRPNARPGQSLAPKPPIPATNATRPASQMRHKSLNALLGTARGPIGKAAPIRSPFEARKEKENQCVGERASKRQKTVHSPVAQMSSSPAEASNQPGPVQTPPRPAAPVLASTSRAPKVPHSRPPVLINLVSEPDIASSDVTLPSTPPGIVQPASRPNTASAPARKERKAAPGAPMATPKIPKGPVPVPHVKARQPVRPPREPSSPPVSACNRLANVDLALQLDSDHSVNAPAPAQPAQSPSEQHHATTVETTVGPPNQKVLAASPPRRLIAKSLRLSKGVKRGTLLCRAKPSAPNDEPRDAQIPKEPGQKRRRATPQEETILVISDDDDALKLKSLKPKPDRRRQKEKRKKKGAPQPASMIREPERSSLSPASSLASFDDMEFVHGLLDQQLEVEPSPPPSPSLSNGNPLMEDAPDGASKPTIGHEDRARGANSSPSAPISKIKEAKASVEEEGNAKQRKKQRQPKNPQLIRKASPVADPDSRNDFRQDLASLAPAQVNERQGAGSKSMPPPKKPALSTGGFQKTPKSKNLQSAANNAGIPPPRPVGVTLPPPPIPVSRPGPSISTTERPSLLAKSHVSIGLSDDPIEDSSQPRSPAKSLQRSRSENDAPIPSTSEEWEQRNLPKSAGPTVDATTPANAGESSRSKPNGLAALVKRTDPRRKFQRTQSLNVDTNIAAATKVDVQVVTPPLDTDVGPWSTEAFDLFDWRPPAGDEFT